MGSKWSETIKASKQTKQYLTRVAARLQKEAGRRIDLDETIQHLISLIKGEPRPELLDKVFGRIPNLSLADLRSERRLDEFLARAKYGY